MGGGTNPLKTMDPLGTPVNSIVLPVQQLKSEQAAVTKPMYAELMRDVQSPPPTASVHGGDYGGHAGPGHDELPQPIAQTRRPQPPQSPQHAPVARQMEYDEAEAAYAPPPRPTYAVSPPPPPQSTQTQLKMKKSALSVEAQRNSLVLLSVTAIVLHFLAPRIRVYPRFTSNSGIGLSYTGVAVVSLAIVVGYKAITYAAGLRE